MTLPISGDCSWKGGSMNKILYQNQRQVSLNNSLALILHNGADAVRQIFVFFSNKKAIPLRNGFVIHSKLNLHVC
jgi:hypothetical protein